MPAPLDSGSLEIDIEEESYTAAGLSAGGVVAERYRLESVIGRGGIATVWRARDRLLDRAVALKVLSSLSGPAEEGPSYDRFLREARICAAIRHPNVVHLLDFGASSGRPYLVMELLEGEALDRRLERVVQLDLHEAVAIAVGMLDGLEAAHAAGVIHRDLKPANVFLVREAEGLVPKLLDFGVSRSIDGARRSALTTADGHIFGTPAYMSPEQARGSRALDRRSDLYTAAVIVYECLAGVLPYESEALGDLIVEIVTGEAPPLSRIRPDVGPVSDVLARAMLRRPEDRYATAREMRDALVEATERISRQRGAPTMPQGLEDQELTVVDTPVRPPRTPRRIDVERVGGQGGERTRGLALVAFGALLVLASGLVVLAQLLAPRTFVPAPIVAGPLVAPLPSAPSPEPPRADAPPPASVQPERDEDRGGSRAAPGARARAGAQRQAPPAGEPAVFRELDY